MRRTAILRAIPASPAFGNAGTTLSAGCVIAMKKREKPCAISGSAKYRRAANRRELERTQALYRERSGDFINRPR